MLAKYRTTADNGLRFSPFWDAEAAVFDPASTRIFVVTESAARLLAAVQRYAMPASVADLVACLASEPRFHAPNGLADEVEAMLVELERLGLVESTTP